MRLVDPLRASHSEESSTARNVLRWRHLSRPRRSHRCYSERVRQRLPGGAIPQTCAKVERFHQTQKKWLATKPGAATLAELQDQLEVCRDYYNHVQPHRALSRHTLAEAYAARPKATASGIPLIDGHFRVRHYKIDTNGKLTLRHNSRLHHIGLGRRYAGTPSHRPERERCPGTPVNGVPRHRTGAGGGSRTPTSEGARSSGRRGPASGQQLHHRHVTGVCDALGGLPLHLRT